MTADPLHEPARPPLQTYLLGLVELEDVLALQRRLVYDLGESRGAALILCEHPPTITVGRSGSRAHIAVDDDELKHRGIQSVWINRGGGCVLHMPGQLAGYLVIPLAPLGMNLFGYLDRLHQALISLLDEFELPGARRDEQGGVYYGNTRIASVGVAVNRWIAYHGFTLNVSTYLEPYEELLDEPGPRGSHSRLRQTSMEARRQRPAPMPMVREAVIRQVEAAFGLEQQHVYTQHPLIRRKVRSHVYAQSLG